jgi:hypothetical protein
MPLYRKLFKQSLLITWKNKYLWFFGFFAALLGNGGDYEIISRATTNNTSGQISLGDLMQTNVFSGQTLITIKDFMAEEPLSFVLTLLVGLFILVMTCFLIWLVNVSQAALVNNAIAISAGKTTGFKEGLEVGKKNFWPVLSLNLMSKILTSLIFVIISFPMIMSADRPGAAGTGLLYLLVFLIFIPIAIILAFIIKYAIAYKVIKGDDLFISLAKAWNLFRENWLVSVEMAFALFFINVLFGLAVIFLVMILALPFLFLALVLYYMTSVIGFWLIAILALIFLFLLVMVAGAASATFQISSWSTLFIELTGRGATAKVVRAFGGLLGGR